MRMVSKEEFLHLFDRFALLICQPGICQAKDCGCCQSQTDPQFGLACLGKINMTYESDRDLMIRFYEFIAKEEMACEEAELGPDRFAERLTMQQNLQEQQLEMLKYMRSFHMDDQSAILEKIHQQSNKANFETGASVMTVEQMQDVVRRRVSPLFQPR
ncbi:uncharacterized protein LOC125859371 isoform X2 [Solanum stenotomum]|uniref:uncharacterized protein LOC125859371 isoform X2 n=1 Tax=Solanum stenotomum TaxID=172797 RepID=UPI0020CFFE12|nr:uncharacterized protein LOC125859371 isoform X2 [Solanum stenotomum]